jgi:uncharacterized membrane protein
MRPSRTLYSRSRSNRYPILISFVFVLIGVWMIRDGVWWGWAAVVVLGLGLVALLVSSLPEANWLRLEPTGFQVRQSFRGSSVAWSEVKQFFLTSDGLTVVYELFPEPGEASEDPDEYFAHFSETYGLSAPELLELLNAYQQSAGPDT